MATYEEICADFGGPSGTVSRSAFRFPDLSPAEREIKRQAASEVTAPSESQPVSAALMRDVLGRFGISTGSRQLKRIVYDHDSIQDHVIEKAAAAVKAIRNGGRAVAGYDPENPDPFWDACADTTRTALEVEDSLADEVEAAIASEIFRAAEFYSGRITVLTDAAKVQIQILVMSIVRQVKFMFAVQGEIDI